MPHCKHTHKDSSKVVVLLKNTFFVFKIKSSSTKETACMLYLSSIIRQKLLNVVRMKEQQQFISVGTEIHFSFYIPVNIYLNFHGVMTVFFSYFFKKKKISLV